MYSSAVDPKPSIDRKCSLASPSSSAAYFFRLRTVFVEAVFEVDYLIAQLGENRLVVLPLALPALRHLTVAPACGIQTPLAPPLEIGVLDVLHAVPSPEGHESVDEELNARVVTVGPHQGAGHLGKGAGLAREDQSVSRRRPRLEPAVDLLSLIEADDETAPDLVHQAFHGAA
jgi:hypothetical protein